VESLTKTLDAILDLLKAEKEKKDKYGVSVATVASSPKGDLKTAKPAWETKNTSGIHAPSSGSSAKGKSEGKTPKHGVGVEMEMRREQAEGTKNIATSSHTSKPSSGTVKQLGTNPETKRKLQEEYDKKQIVDPKVQREKQMWADMKARTANSKTSAPRPAASLEVSNKPKQEDKVIRRKKDDVKKSDDIFKSFVEELELRKSNYGPKHFDLYDANKNQTRKQNNTGEALDDIGQNKNVKQYTSAVQGTAATQADKQAKIDKKKSSKNPVKTKDQFTPEQIQEMENAANKLK